MMNVTIKNHTTEGLMWQNWHIARPERLNALGTTICCELNTALDLARTDLPKDVRAIVITAETVVRNENAYWIAGGDLIELSQLNSKSKGRGYAESMRCFCQGLETLSLPIFTVVDGIAIGGGAELAIAGDIRFATSRSIFEFRQLKVGLPTGYGAATRLVELVGKSQAQRLLYFCSSLDSQACLDLGLIHSLISSTSLDDIGSKILPILQLEPRAFAAQKKMLRLATSQMTGDQKWADDIFESAWMNQTHSQILANFKKV
jgi:enoyl-CoA hydratase